MLLTKVSFLLCYNEFMSIDIEKLSALARIDVPDDVMAKLEKDLESVVGYVSEIGQAVSEKTDQNKSDNLVLKNVMRVDDGAHAQGIYTEDIMNEVPKKEGAYVSVKPILEK